MRTPQIVPVTFLAVRMDRGLSKEIAQGGLLF